LEAAITAHNGVSLSTSDLQKLVAYLQQIGSEESSAPTQTTNLAQGRPPRQSSTAYSGAASRAVDGNTNGVYNQNSVTHTNNDTNAWWQVDLGSARTIETIQLFNRTDCCSNRLSNFYVFVSNSDMTGRSYTNLVRDAAVKKYWVSGQAPASLTLNAATSGRYVRVQLSGRNYLSLAEVQVWGR
jgi:hypothetical protein